MKGQNHVGKQIEAARKEKKLKRSELAEAIGLTGKAVWKIETTGKTTTNTLERISGALGVEFVVGQAA